MTLKSPLRRPARRALAKLSLPMIVAVGFVIALALPPPVRAVRVPQETPGAPPLASPPSDPAPTVPAEVLGLSGKLRAVMGTPDSLVRNPFLQSIAALPLEKPGIHRLAALAPDGDSLVALALVPYDAKRGMSLGGYRIGSWPSSPLARANPQYRPPQGFIEVSRENEKTKVSKSFRLGDFLTHDQAEVWPKFLVLRPALLDKLELVREELERRGLPSRLHVMSGFRTPQYNALGVGTGGRASHSRHMYGDAADVFIDENGDGMMDDVNRDGRVTRGDAQVLLAAAERVESAHPELSGGLSAYPANSAHGPFVHVDARGVKARW